MMWEREMEKSTKLTYIGSERHTKKGDGTHALAINVLIVDLCCEFNN